MTLQEIKSAHLSGQTVFWKSEGYQIKGRDPENLVVCCNYNNHCTGLTDDYLAEDFFIKPAPDSTFTFWAQQSDGTGTIYIGSLEAPDLEAAKTAAVVDVCEEWNSTQLEGFPPAYTPDNIHLLGIAAGDVKILYWQDICEA